MIKNYLKITIRNLFRTKVYVAINVLGLGLALACCIVAYLNSKFNWDFDKSHTQIDHIYKIHTLREQKGEKNEYGRVPMPLAMAIKDDIPAVDRAFRLENHVFTVRDINMDKVFSTQISYADPGFLASFTFKPVDGNMKAYHSIDKAIVTKTYADKFYEGRDPIGKILTVFDDTGMSFNFMIAGVVEKAPQNSSVNFEILLNFENRFRMYDDKVKGNWEAMTQITFLYLDDPNKASEIEPLLDKYIPIQNAAKPDFIMSEFILSPMNNHAHISNDIRWDVMPDAMPLAAVLTPQIMALLILLVACFNFTNTAIANSNKRLKEIGIRKVLGGNKRQLILQFMTENLTICFSALLVSLVLASYMVPAYAAMWGDMELKFDYNEDVRLYLFLFALLFVTTLLAGLYPSLYVSKYQPVQILRGKISIGSSSKLSKGLLMAQYTLTIIAMFASVAFIQNAKYQDSLDIGFDQDQIIGVSLLNEDQHVKMKASMLANPDIEMIASTKNHIGKGNYGLTLKNNEVEVDVNMLDVGNDYLEVMGLTVTEGRSFTKDLEASDSKNSIIVNYKFVEEMGWTAPIGQIVSFNDTSKLTVVGVINNFYMYGVWAPIEPVGIRLKSVKFEDDGTYSFMIARVNVLKTKEVYSYLEKEWNGKIPNKTFVGFYQDESLQEAKEVNNNIMMIFVFLCIVAFVLSCLGLFTMVSINLIRRVKEIGIRKVLGGTVLHIVKLINQGYFWLLLGASALGLLGGYYLIDSLIASIYQNYKPMDIYTFSIPIITVLVVSLTITSLKTIKTAVINPVYSLRYE
ncbi:MAG: ABC transporter permease [Reichenbachiella sp.]